MNETECVDIVDDLSETETVDYFGYKDISVCLLIDAFSFVIQKERLWVNLFFLILAPESARENWSARIHGWAIASLISGTTALLTGMANPCLTSKTIFSCNPLGCCFAPWWFPWRRCASFLAILLSSVSSSVNLWSIPFWCTPQKKGNSLYCPKIGSSYYRGWNSEPNAKVVYWFTIRFAISRSAMFK